LDIVEQINGQLSDEDEGAEAEQQPEPQPPVAAKPKFVAQQPKQQPAPVAQSPAPAAAVGNARLESIKAKFQKK